MSDQSDHRTERVPPPEPDEDGPTDSTTIIVGGDGEATPQIDPKTGVLKIEGEDGSVSIDLNPPTGGARGDDKGDFYANLADIISKDELGRIASDLLAAIEADENSRKEWLEIRAKGIEMLGFKIEQPRGDTGASSAPVEGMSTVRHPLLAEAVIAFQSNASGELLPTSGPVKVRNDAPSKPAGAPDAPIPAPGVGHNGGPALEPEMAEGAPAPGILQRVAKFFSPAPAEDEQPPAPTPPGLDNDDLAEALEKDFNHYLTVTDKGYRPDTDRMLFWCGFGGCGFKKVYNDPVRRMPISRSVDATDLIVANSANDIDDAGRVTHKIKMRKSTLIRMQLAGVYRKTTITQPVQQSPTAIETTKDQVQGFQPPQRPEDQDYTILETYVELDIKGFEHQNPDRTLSGLQLPYRVTLDKDSKEILEIRRNWKENDPDCLAKKVFVKYPFVPAFGFYEVGLLQILGNTDMALTGAWRMMLDAGMFSSFPGFLYADVAGRQVTNEFRVPPGGGVRIQTGGKPIQDAVMPLPYKEPSQALQGLIKDIEASGARVAGTSQLQVSEGKQDAPVGTTLALIEQATKILAAVHIRLHAAQAEEFQLLKERFRENPEAFWRGRKTARKWQVDEFLAALDNCDIVPAADPNTPSHMHRIMKAVAVKQLQQANPQLYDPRAVDSRILRMIGIPDPESLFNNAPPPPPMQPAVDPAKMAALDLKKQELVQGAQEKAQDQQAEAAQQERQAQARTAETTMESADRAADRASRERVAITRETTERIKAVSGLIEKGLIPVDVGMGILQSLHTTPGGAGAPPAPPAAVPAPPPAPGATPRVI